MNSEDGQTSRCLGVCYQGGMRGLAVKRGQKEKQNANSLSYLAIKAHPARQQCVTDRYWTIFSDINSFGDFTPHL